jgi:hypothetical protein
MAVTTVSAVTVDRATEAVSVKKVDVPGGLALVAIHSDGGSVNSMAMAFAPAAPPVTVRLPLAATRNVDGLAVVTTGAASGAFTYALTPGTSESLSGAVSKSATITTIGCQTTRLPPGYTAGNALNAIINVKVTGAGTVDAASTIDLSAYREVDAGTQGADLVSTAATAITTTTGDITFVIDGTTLVPNDLLALKFTAVYKETGGASNINSTVGGVRLVTT